MTDYDAQPARPFAHGAPRAVKHDQAVNRNSVAMLRPTAEERTAGRAGIQATRSALATRSAKGTR